MPPDQERIIRTPGASVFISYDISPTDSDGKFVEPEDGRALYTQYTITNRLYRDGHKYLMSIASEEAIPSGQNTSAVVTLGRPTLIWVCQWLAEKCYEKPEIPNPESSDSLWELLDAMLTTDNITVAGDGDTPVYRIGGVYIYGNLRPSNSVIGNVQFPRVPWLEDAYSRTVDPSQLRGGLSEIQLRALRTTGANPANPPFRVS